MPKDTEVIDFLNMHLDHFCKTKIMADKTKQPVPDDSRAVSQVLISLLTGIPGLERKKGPDLADGSDVKAANTWAAIDYPRFNGVIKSGTKSSVAGKMESLDVMPFLFFVMWDYEPIKLFPRVRVWVVRTQHDKKFRKMCEKWYQQRSNKEIKSDNFQLHPPIGNDSNCFRNQCGNLEYPLFFKAVWSGKTYKTVVFDANVLVNGECQ